jgi:hypothetical protein
MGWIPPLLSSPSEPEGSLTDLPTTPLPNPKPLIKNQHQNNLSPHTHRQRIKHKHFEIDIHKPGLREWGISDTSNRDKLLNDIHARVNHNY